MAKSLSLDLRSRVFAAIDAGLSCRKATIHFGVSAASAIRWQELVHRQGTPVAKKQGGDQRSQVIEAHGALIRKLLEEKHDITLEELKQKLAERGVSAGVTTPWRFFKRHNITLKKSRPMPRNSNAPTYWGGVNCGSKVSSTLIRSISSSLTRRALPRKWRDFAGVRQEAST